MIDQADAPRGIELGHPGACPRRIRTAATTGRRQRGAGVSGAYWRQW